MVRILLLLPIISHNTYISQPVGMRNMTQGVWIISRHYPFIHAHGYSVVNTKAIYLSVLETGLCLIAVNLPSLWFLFSKVKPESVLRSVRSMISLRSNRSAASSQGKGGTQSHPSSLGKNQHDSSSSKTHLALPDAQSVQTYAMRDLEYEEYGPPMPLGKIQVTGRIFQSAEHV